jgi:hypothetical protein
MLLHNCYDDFRPLAHLEVAAIGGVADKHLMASKDVIEALSALTNIGSRTTLLCLGRPIPGPEDIGNVNVLVSAPSKGSFLMDIVVGVASDVIVRTLSKPVEEGVKDIWSALLGTRDTPIPRVEPWFDDVLEVAERLHSSFQQLSNLVRQSVERIDILSGIDRNRCLASIDLKAKKELSEEIVNSEAERFEGRVRQLNGQNRKGNN